MVQFSTDRDGVSQLSFHNNNFNSNSGGGLYGNALSNAMQQQQQQPDGAQEQQPQQQQQQQNNPSQPQQQSIGNSQSGNITLQLPLPTPIASLGQQQQTGSTNMNTNQSNQQQQFQGAQQNNTTSGQTNATLAQLIAQLQQSTNSAGQIQQQQQQQLPNMQQVQPPPQQQQPQQATTNQQPQQQQQQMSHFQFPQFSSDPQALLRQLQFAQLQQQLQAAQNNQPQQMQSPQNIQQQKPEGASQQQPQNPMALPVAPATLVQQQQPQQAQAPSSIQQQLQQHFQQAQAAANAPLRQPQQQVQQQAQQQAPSPQPSAASNPSNSMMAPTQVSFTKKPPIKKAPPAPKAPPKASRPSAAQLGRNSASGTVSASDTDMDGHDSKRVKVSQTLSMGEDADLKLEPLDTSNMTPQEKAKANRDRNREHARNTRLRKKAYLEKLKSTVDELCRERDTLVSERAGAANLLVEMHNTRTEVLMSFFALRTTNEKRRKLWASIIDESCFACVMPVTPYQSFPASEVQVSKCLRTVLGIDGIMADTASLHVLMESLVDRSRYPYEHINFRYTLVTEEAVVAGNQMMARWVMTTTNAVQLGSTMEVSKQGMLCCKFNSAHKIIGLELMFDVMAFMLQLKQAAGSEGFTVIPNTVQTCQKSFDKPMIVTLAEPPYTIIQVNNLWEEMTGYSAEEVVGKASCSILQAPDMDRKPLVELMREVRFKRPASALLVNRNKSGMDFTNYLVVYPLSTDSRITYFLGLTTFTKIGHPSCPPPLVSDAQQTAQHNTAVAGQVNYDNATQVPSSGSQSAMLPPMMFGQMGQMPPPSAAVGMLNLQQQQAQQGQQ